MPGDEDALGLEVLLGFDEVLGEVLAVVRDLSPHVVHHEGLREVVPVVRERHRLEVKSHGGARLDVPDFEVARSGVHVRVEELSEVGAVLGEVGVRETLLPLLIVVDDVVGLRAEELAQTLVLEQLIEDPHLVDGGLSTAVTDASSQSEAEEGEVDLPDEGVREHVAGEGGPANESLGPPVVAAVELGVGLVEVVGGTHAVLHVLVVEDVVGGGVGVGVFVGPGGLGMRRPHLLDGVEVHVVQAVGGLEPHVVVAGVRVFAEVASLAGHHHALRDRDQ